MSSFQQLTNHIFIMHPEHETDRPILAAIAGEKRTLLMDAGASATHAETFKTELIRQGIRLPDMLFLTHWHWDHSFGSSAWILPTIAHRETARALQKLVGLDWSDETLEALKRDGMASDSTIAHIKKEYGDHRTIQIATPDILFDDELRIDLGRLTCEIRHVGGDHAHDSCLLHVVEDRTLFLGDALGPSVYGGPRSYTPSRFCRLLEQIYHYDADILVESHALPADKNAFRADLDQWEHLARLVDLYSHDRQKIAREMTAFLQVETLPDDFATAIEWFITGAQRSQQS